MVRSLIMEKMMSKTNNPSNLVTFGDHNTLADSELDAVSGEAVDRPAGREPIYNAKAMQVWLDLTYQVLHGLY